MHFRLETEGTKTYKHGLFCLNQGVCQLEEDSC